MRLSFHKLQDGNRVFTVLIYLASLGCIKLFFIFHKTKRKYSLDCGTTLFVAVVVSSYTNIITE